MACLNAVIVISSLTLALHGLFVNATGKGNEVPTETGLFQGSSDLTFHAISKRFVSDYENTLYDDRMANGEIATAPDVGNYPEPVNEQPPLNNEMFDRLNDLISMQQPPVEYNRMAKGEIATAPEIVINPEPVNEQPPMDNEMFNRFNNLLSMQQPPVEYIHPPHDNYNLGPGPGPEVFPGSSDPTLPAISGRFGSVDENTLNDNKITDGEIVNAPGPSIRYPADHLENYPEPDIVQPPLDNEMMNKFNNLMLMKKDPVEYIIPPNDGLVPGPGPFLGSSDPTLPEISGRFGSVDENTFNDNRITTGEIATVPETNIMDPIGSLDPEPDYVQPPLDNDMINKFKNLRSMQKDPVEYIIPPNDNVNVITNPGGNAIQQRIGVISSNNNAIHNVIPPNDNVNVNTYPDGNAIQQRIGVISSNNNTIHNEFVNYDFDVIYDEDEEDVKKQDSPLIPENTGTADRAAEDPKMDETLSSPASTKKGIRVEYDASLLDDYDESTTAATVATATTVEPTAVTTKKIIRADYDNAFRDDYDESTTAATVATATTVEPTAVTTKKIIRADYDNAFRDDYDETSTVTTTSNTETTPEVPHRMDPTHTEANPGVQTTTPEDDDSSTDDNDDSTDGNDVTMSPDDVTEKVPMACKYGTAENPYPVPNIIRTGRRVSDIKCDEHMWHLKYRIIDENTNRKTCMTSMKFTQVVGGITSKEGDFPHMGAVGWSLADNSVVYLCGASLISVRFSITAGHCRALPGRGQVASIIDPYPKVVRFGSADLKNDGNSIDMKIDEFIITKEYEAHRHWKYNDTGLIRFTEDVPISEFVRPACLWDGNLRGHSTGIITGWGQTSSVQIDSTSSHLQYAIIDFLNRDVCHNLLHHRKNRLWNYGLIDSQFCAGKLTGGVDTCQGDSGGPIQVREPLLMDSSFSMYHVVGLTNFGIKCAEPNTPGVYTNVTHFLCWIEKTVWPDEENKLCP